MTIETICEAALTVLDRDGLEQLTMRRVADELGTGPASLYRHVASREELLIEVVDRVLGELPAPDESLPWRDAVERLANDLRTVLLGHRAVVLSYANSPLLGPNAIRIRELFWRAMDRDGCDPRFAVQTFFTVMHFVASSAQFTAGMAHRGGQHPHGQVRSGLSDVLDALPASQYPTVLKFSEYGDSANPEHEFRFGLAALLDGLARTQDAR